MSVNAFPSTITSFTIVLLITGVVFGLILGHGDLFTPSMGVAQAEGRQAGDKYAEVQRQLELTFFKQKREAELAAWNAEQQQKLALAEERYRLETEWMDQRARVVNAALPIVIASGALVVLVAGGALAYYVVSLARNAPGARAGVQWGNGRERAEAVRAAREAERAWRVARLPRPDSPGAAW